MLTTLYFYNQRRIGMDTLSTILMAVGVIALPVAIIMLIISLIKKKSKKTSLIVFAVGIVMFILGGVLTPSEPVAKEEPQVTQNSVVQAIEKGVLQYPSSNENFKYNVYDTYVEITEYIGNANASKINVPAKLENLPVYVVDSYVFDECKVQTIVFEEGIYDIKSGFSSSLKSVTLPSTLKCIGSSQFENCYALEKVVIPEGIKSIMFSAFESCSSLKEITIPSTVTSLSTGLFAYCTKLETVNLSNGLTSIGEKAFVQCESLKTIKIPDTVTELGFNAFQGSGLVSVEIPASVITIGANAFLACESLKEVKFHNSAVTIKPYTYYEQGVAMATTTALFGQCNKDLVVYGKPASEIAKACAKDNVYFKAF